MTRIIDWAVGNTRVVLGLLAVVIIAGISAFTAIPKEAQPDIPIPVIMVEVPYPGISEGLRPGGMLREVAAATGRRIVFFCAFGERSAMAVTAAKNAGLANTVHIAGGIDAWKKAGGPVITNN